MPDPLGPVVVNSTPSQRLGLKLTGTFGVLLRAKSLGILQAVEPVIMRMRHGGVWLSDALISRVLQLADEA